MSLKHKFEKYQPTAKKKKKKKKSLLLTNLQQLMVALRVQLAKFEVTFHNSKRLCHVCQMKLYVIEFFTDPKLSGYPRLGTHHTQ